MNDIIMFGVSGIATLLLLACRAKRYNMRWKSIVIIFVIVGAVGYLGAIFGSYVSYGSWRGVRFYGRVLFATVALWCIAKIFKVPSVDLMDYYAPIDILALAIMKVNCLRTGCCAGIELFVDKEGSRVCFPSQIAELFVAIVIFVLLIVLEQKSKCEGFRYYIYLLIYGSTRFVFDYFRATPSHKICIADIIISMTQVFCVVLFVIGVMGIYKIKKISYAKSEIKYN